MAMETGWRRPSCKVTTSYLVDTLNPTGYAQVLDEVQSGAVTRSYAWGLQLVSETQLVAATPPASPVADLVVWI